MVEILGSLDFLRSVLLDAFNNLKGVVIRTMGIFLVYTMLVSVVPVSAGYNSLGDVPADKLKNLEAAWKAGVEEGVSEASLAGMLANANAESGYDPFLAQYGGPAWGFFQMESERQARLKSFLNKNNASDDPVKASYYSMKFVIQELKSDNMFLTYGLEGDPNGTGRYGGPQSWGGLYRYDVLQYVHGGGKKISASAEEFYKNTDPVKAAVEFMVSYERAHSSRSTLHLDLRIKLAKEIFQKYSGSLTSTDVNTDGNTTSTTQNGVNSRTITIGEDLSRWEASESDIPNMPTERDYKEAETSFEEHLKDAEEGLVQSDREGIAKWKEERESTLARQSIDTVRMGILIMSMLLLLAPSALMTAFFADLWMVGLDSPFLRMVTFNRIAVDYDRTGGSGLWFSDKKVNKALKIKRMGAGDLFVWCLVFSIVGVLGISGYLFMYTNGALDYISEALGYFK